MFPTVIPRYEVIHQGAVLGFFTLPVARAHARASEGSKIFDCERHCPVSVDPPIHNAYVQAVLSYDGKAHHAPPQLRHALFSIRKRARELCGKKMAFPIEVIAQAKQEWLERIP